MRLETSFHPKPTSEQLERANLLGDISQRSHSATCELPAYCVMEKCLMVCMGGSQGIAETVTSWVVYEACGVAQKGLKGNPRGANGSKGGLRRAGSPLLLVTP